MSRVRSKPLFDHTRRTSHVRGYYQAPILTWATRLLFAFAVVAVAVSGRGGEIAGGVVITLAIVVPLGRVAWLIVRWAQEGDHRFVAVGIALLAVIAVGGVLYFGR